MFIVMRNLHNSLSISKLRHLLSIVDLDELLMICSVVNLPLVLKVWMVDLWLIVVYSVDLAIDASLVFIELIDKFNFVLVHPIFLNLVVVLLR